MNREEAHDPRGEMWEKVIAWQAVIRTDMDSFNWKVFDELWPHLEPVAAREFVSEVYGTEDDSLLTGVAEVGARRANEILLHGLVRMEQSLS